jgi:signal transduction histidine kinase/CheY-like chemotaxis protein
MFKIRLIVLFCFFSFQFKCNAQTPFLDSLKTELLKSTNAVDSVKLLNALVFNSWDRFPNDARRYGIQSFEKSKGISDQVALGWSYFAIGLGHHVTGERDKAKSFYKNSFNIGACIKGPNLIAWSGYQLYNISLEQGNIEEANIYLKLGFSYLFKIISGLNPTKDGSMLSSEVFISLVDNALRTVSKREYKFSKSSYYFYISCLYENFGNRKEAMNYIYNAIENAHNGEWDMSLLKSYYQAAYYFAEIQQNYPMALTYYLHTVESEMADSTINKYGHIFLNIGKVYRLMGKDSLSYEYIKRGFEKGRLLNNSQAIASANLQLGDLYVQTNRIEEAILCYNKIQHKGKKQLAGEYFPVEHVQVKDTYLKLDEDDYAEYYLSTLYHEAQTNLGDIYTKRKNYCKAYKCYKNGYLAIDNRVNYKAVVRSYQSLGDLCMADSSYKHAINYFLKAYKFSCQIFFLEGQRNSAHKLSEIYSIQNDYLNAYEYLQIANTLFDSINKMKIADRNANLETWFDFIQLEAQNKLEKTKSRFFAFGLVLTGIILILLFIAYRRKKKQKEIVEGMSKKIHEADMAKLRLFTNISHEFRTPLTLILAPLMRLRKTIQDDEAGHNFDIILKNADKLKSLVKQQLDVAKINNEGIELDKGPSDIARLFKITTSMFSPIADTKRIDFVIKANIDTLTFDFDKIRIEHVLTNLLTNAFKYTDEGGNIEASLYWEENIIKIVVRDSGIGIPAEVLDKIFERFYQVDGSIEGTGLGLTIAKEYVELHSGTLSVNSEYGNGSEFVVTIPVPEVYIEPYEKQNEEKGIGATGKLPEMPKVIKAEKSKNTILIVEDNHELRDYLTQLFMSDFNIVTAMNGQEGKSKALIEEIDLIVSDVMMPVCDGFQMTDDLKSSIDTSHIPVILLTAKATHEDKMAGYKYGADDYIVKPFNENELELKVRNILKTRNKIKQKLKQGVNISVSEISVSSIDEKLLNKITQCVEDNISNSGFSIDKLCGCTGLSRRNMFRKLKALTGMSPSEFIRYVRLKRAAQLLEQKAGSVSEIAFQTGFENLSYFSKCFKEVFQKLPSEYV